MQKSKLMFGLFTLVLVLALAQGAFAQISVTVTSNPSPRETGTNRMAETNDPVSGGSLIISGTALSSAFVTIGRIRIDYPSNITSDAAGPGGTGAFPGPAGLDPIVIESATGIFAGTVISTIDFVEGRIELDPPNRAPLAGDTGTIILSGVRIDANGLTAPVDAAITLQGTNVNVILNTATATVISAFSPGIGAISQGGISSSTVAGIPADQGVATVFTNRSVPDPRATFTISEGHRVGWFNNSTTQLPGAPADWQNDAGMRLTFNNLPAGVTLTLSVDGSTIGAAPGAACVSLSRTGTGNITTANNVIVVGWTCDLPTSSSALDSVQFLVTVSNVTSTATLAPGSVTVQATMSPIGGALTDTSTPDKSASPRFAELSTAPLTILAIIPANTTLLVPFAVKSGAFDTGIALANTSYDPFSGAGGATLQTGGVRLDFFPRAAAGAGTPFGASTSATFKPGIGLSADGSLAPGSTWTVLLSELLAAAGQTGDFTGYIFIRADFLGAHGAPFVSDFRNFTSFTPMLVLSPPSITPRFSGTPFEGLHF